MTDIPQRYEIIAEPSFYEITHLDDQDWINFQHGFLTLIQKEHEVGKRKLVMNYYTTNAMQ